MSYFIFCFQAEFIRSSSLIHSCFEFNRICESAVILDLPASRFRIRSSFAVIPFRRLITSRLSYLIRFNYFVLMRSDDSQLL